MFHSIREVDGCSFNVLTYNVVLNKLFDLLYLSIYIGFFSLGCAPVEY